MLVNIQDNGNTLEFRRKKSNDLGPHRLLAINLKDIETSRTTTIRTKHMLFTKNKLVLEIVFISDSQNNKRSIQVGLYEGYIPIVEEQIITFRNEEDNHSIIKAIALQKNPKLCIQCAKKPYALEYSSNYNLCLDCFTYNYGKVLLQAPIAQYYGGHKAYLGGGTFDKYEVGRLILSEHYIIFAKQDKKNPSKRWEIIIPLQSIIIERWGVEEVGRRQDISGGGTAMGNFGFGGGTVHESGKAHHIVVPYIDENGIPQEPRFGISSFRGKAIREWALRLYEQVVKEKTDSANASPQPLSLQPANKYSSNNNLSASQPSTVDDPLKILKLRFAKGEITKEDYEEMRKMLES